MKRAQMFSLIALLMSSLFVALFVGFTHVPLDKDVVITNAKIDHISYFVEDLDSVLDSAIDRSTYEILRTTVANFDASKPYDDYHRIFIECFDYGTYLFDDVLYPCNTSGVSKPIGASLSSSLNDSFSLARSLYAVNITYDVLHTDVAQMTPYSLEVNATLRVRVGRDDAYWDRLLDTSREVSFIGITDPMTIGTNFTRPLLYRPVPVGEIFRSTSFNGNVSLIKEYMDEGYYFRDYTGLSFIESLEGRPLTSMTEYNRYGLGSFVPIFDDAGNSLYRSNNSLMVTQFYIQDFRVEPCAGKRRFNYASTGINSSIILPTSYVVNDLGVNGTLVRHLLYVCGDEEGNEFTCCDDSGCDPSCGNIE